MGEPHALRILSGVTVSTCDKVHLYRVEEDPCTAETRDASRDDSGLQRFNVVVRIDVSLGEVLLEPLFRFHIN